MSISYSRPVIGGVSQLAGWGTTLTVERALAALGRNSGNVMFTESLRRILKNSRMSSFNFDAAAIAGRDAIVLAAANWINEYEDFGWLYGVLAPTKLPIFLVGVGAQATLSGSIPKVKPGTLRFLNLVAERSTSISARGEFTCEVLNHYGIKTGTITGCPSLLLLGPNGPQRFRQPSMEHVVLHATRHGFGKCDEFQRFLYKQALEREFDVLLQSEEADIYYVKDRTNNPGIMARASEAVKFAYGINNEELISSFLRKHGMFFLNYETWIEAMSTKTFCIGTRIHGTIASIISGTPATLIAHDSRTLELAKAMNLPYVLSSDVPVDKALDVEACIQLFRECAVEQHYGAYRSRFLEFFRTNGLEMSGNSSVALGAI